jgi:simple sugar transport system substrate-binding protein/D-xylose transport system substrate-binding protein
VPTVVTRYNIKEIVFDSGVTAAKDVCTGRYAAGCDQLGIK